MLYDTLLGGSMLVAISTPRKFQQAVSLWDICKMPNNLGLLRTFFEVIMAISVLYVVKDRERFFLLVTQ